MRDGRRVEYVGFKVKFVQGGPPGSDDAKYFDGLFQLRKFLA